MRKYNLQMLPVTLEIKNKKLMKKYIILTFFGLFIFSTALFSQPFEWYTQGDFEPQYRVEFVIENSLDIDRENTPVTIKRENFPLPDVHEMWVTVVDPLLTPRPAPTSDTLAIQGGHHIREETHGRMIHHQMDDLNKDGVWDELFFQMDLKAKEKRTIHIYIGYNGRGWNPHRTHANIGSYCRHVVPFWESEDIGWKLWFANTVDVFGKRKPLLMSQRLYMDNLDGYGVAFIDEDFGTDIMSVSTSFGGGGIGLFEFEDQPGKVSRPRFTPAQEALAMNASFNAGQISDTRYAYDVVVNGPVRSMIRIKAMNWDTGNGNYEYEQYYTAYTGQSYSTSKVVFTQFLPKQKGVLMGAGVRQKPGEDDFVQEGGMLITSGPEVIRDPTFEGDEEDREEVIVPFVGQGLVVKDKYEPEYQFVSEHLGNHTYRITPDSNNSYEFMILAGWAEGAVYNTIESFNEYVRKSALEFNHPVIPHFIKKEEKP